MPLKSAGCVIGAWNALPPKPLKFPLRVRGAFSPLPPSPTETIARVLNAPDGIGRTGAMSGLNSPPMSDTPHSELRDLVSGAPLDAVVKVKGANDRVDALTLYCREILRSSTLCYIGGLMHYYGGRCFLPASPRDVLSALTNTLVDAGVSPLDARRMGDMPLAVIAERSFAPKNLICFSNGVLDLDGGTFHEGFSPDLIVTENLPYPYSPDAVCPLWEKFLGEVLPDAATRRVLQEFAGCCYLDRHRYSIEKFAIFLGEGANGKSVIREVLSDVMGRGNVCGYDAEQLTRTELLPYLIGKRINFASDMKVSAAFDSALKALASGQDVVGRKIYADPVTINCPPIIFSMNALPPFRDTSPAFFRRVLLFEFGVVIPEGRRDTSLASRISASESSGVFRWIMEGASRLMAQGGAFSPCPAMESALNRLQSRTSLSGAKYPVRAWMERNGYSPTPLYEGQLPVVVPQGEIMRGIGGISPTSISRELSGYGVASHRNKEIFYRLYEKTNE